MKEKNMKEKINACLNSTWDSTYGGINTIKAIDKLYELVQEELDKQAYRIVNLKGILNSTERELIDVLELLKETLPELKLLLDIHSNNINKKAQLELLIKNIEEQIDGE